MDKTIAGLLGASAIAALSATSAQATGVQATSIQDTSIQAAGRLDHVMKAETYADLLEPVADPLPLLEASNAVLLTQAGETPLTAEPVQYHHHHHHSILRRLFRPRRYYHHHHFYHHHHHHHFYRY